MVVRLWCFLFFIIWGACFLLFDLNAEQEYGGNFDTVFSQLGNPENVSVYVSKITFSCDIYSLKMMFPENNDDLTAKLLFEQSLFYPIYKKLIFAWRLRFGHIFRRKFEKIMPIERFYLGGPYFVRGYEPDALPPLGVFESVKDGKTIKYYTIQGGSTMINVNLELRFPLFKSLGAQRSLVSRIGFWFKIQNPHWINSF